VPPHRPDLSDVLTPYFLRCSLWRGLGERMFIRVALIGACLAGTLSGCAAVDGSTAPRYDTLSRNFAQARDESILLNIVRAAHDYPLSFSAISQAIPQLSNGTSLGLPSFFLGPQFCLSVPVGLPSCSLPSTSAQRGAVFGNTTASNSTTIQTQFTLSTQETHDFYQALLRPVDLYIVNYFIRQGYSRELLFWLFADTIEVKIGKFSLGYQYNPPYNYGCPSQDRYHRCFRGWAEIATVSGLSVEEHVSTGGGGGASDSDSSDSGSKKGGGAAKKGGGGGGAGGGSKGQELSRLCFDPVSAEEGTSAMRRNHPEQLQSLLTTYLGSGAAHTLSPQCGSPWPPENANTQASDLLSFSVNGVTFRIVPRSAYGVYQFLGKLLKQSMQDDDTVLLPPSVPLDQVLPELSTVWEDDKILNIIRNSNDQCFVTTHFNDGEYCVPEHGSANTKRIFGLLAQLIALQTTATDLAITPVVHTVN
jgi:hypothetical protein